MQSRFCNRFAELNSSNDLEDSKETSRKHRSHTHAHIHIFFVSFVSSNKIAWKKKNNSDYKYIYIYINT